MTRTIGKAGTLFLSMVLTISILVISWCGFRIVTAMNHGAMRAAVALCIDNRHLILREQGNVPQALVDKTLTRQIWAYYTRNPKRKLPHNIVMISSQIGWRFFWSPDGRRRIYDSLERRMPPCPESVALYRKLNQKRRR